MSKKKGGRPRAKIDCGKLEELAEAMVSQATAARLLGVSHGTLESRLGDEKSPERRAWDLGQARAKHNLRSWQWEKARKGDTGMLIWLGKQYLGQKEKQDVTTDDLPFSRFTVNIEKHGGASRDTEEQQ